MIQDTRPRCDHGVVFPLEHCAVCLKAEAVRYQIEALRAATRIDIATRALRLIAMNSPLPDYAETIALKALGDMKNAFPEPDSHIKP